MAAATHYSPLFDSSGNPVPPNPYRVPAGGVAFVPVTHTIPTIAIDEAGDFMALFPIPSGATPVALLIEACADLDSAAAISLDVSLRTTDKNGVTTDVTLSAGVAGAFGAAVTSKVYTFYGAAPVRSDSATGIGFVGLKTAIVPTGAQAGIIRAALVYR